MCIFYMFIYLFISFAGCDKTVLTRPRESATSRKTGRAATTGGKIKKQVLLFRVPEEKTGAFILPFFLLFFLPSLAVLPALFSLLWTLLFLLYPLLPIKLTLLPFIFLFFFLPPSPLLASPLLTANVCDEEMLLCQNGGTCYMNQKCVCSPEFKGVLCQQSRCEAGKDCNGASSPRLSAAALLLCTLSYLLATLSHHWATKRRPQSPASSYLPTLQTLGVCAHGRGTGTWGGGGHL